jgi:toxin YoeB
VKKAKGQQKQKGAAAEAAARPAGERKARTERAFVLDRHCREDLRWWMGTEVRVAEKALTFMEHVMRDPFSGPGKPEPLKGLASNTWSRRLTGEHRLVYIVFDDRIVFLQARYRY